MARYDYKCTACGTTFEVEHGMSEHPSVACPACGSVAERVFSASGIVFSGSGFYNTDQRDGGKGPASDASAKTAASGEKSKVDAASGSSSTAGEKKSSAE